MFDSIFMSLLFLVCSSTSLRLNKSMISSPPQFLCPPGYYGSECKNKCSKSCNGTCDSSGHCYSCVKSGLRLPTCGVKCLDGSYGYSCSQSCSKTCRESKCDAVTGHCLECDQAGVSLPSCSHACSAGTFGLNCQERCPLVCKESCDRINGMCSQCAAGSGQHCTVNCAMESTKELCALYCPLQCLTWCNTTNSHCALCAPGYSAPFCNMSCASGYYGNNCKNVCSDRCTDGQCDPINGACFSCTDGFVGRKCNGQCIKGYFGKECNLVCPETCLNGSCDFVSGECFQCHDGYTGPYCSELCKAGKYGKNCLQDCPKNCLKACDPATGICWKCLPGYRESYCNVTCEQGSYGDGCSEMCPEYCVCDHVTGKCVECKGDQEGVGCEVSKPLTERDENNTSILELILYTSAGLIGTLLFISLIMWFYKKNFTVHWFKTKKWIFSLKDKKDVNSISGKTNVETRLANFLNDSEMVLDKVIEENDSEDRHKKLINYLKNHGRTYTPKEYDKDELKFQYLKQMQSRSRLAFNDLSEPSIKYPEVSHMVPQVNLSISHSTVVDDAHDEVRQHINHSKRLETVKHKMATTANASNSLARRLGQDLPSFIAYNRVTTADDENSLKPHVSISKYETKFSLRSKDDEKCFVESRTLTKLPNMPNMSFDSDTKGKISDSRKVSKIKSLVFEPNSADSLYGITSQEFIHDQLNSEASMSSVSRRSAPYGCLSKCSSINLIKSEQAIINGKLISGKKKHPKKTLIPATVSNHKDTLNSEYNFAVNTSHVIFVSPQHIIDHVQEISVSPHAQKVLVSPRNLTKHTQEWLVSPRNMTQHTQDVLVSPRSISEHTQEVLVLPHNMTEHTKKVIVSPSRTPKHLQDDIKTQIMTSVIEDTSFKNNLKDYISPVIVGSTNLVDSSSSQIHKFQTSGAYSSRRYFIDIRREKIDSLSDSTFSEMEQESCLDECSSLSESQLKDSLHPKELASESGKEDSLTGSESIRNMKRHKTHSKQKKYRRVSPPKSQSSREHLSLSTVHDEDRRYSMSQTHFPTTTKQSSIARLSSLVTVKADSPRLVRCATTRQLSPMYGMKSSMATKLVPLPTPPPDGRLVLKPIGKQSSSSILELNEDSF